MSLAGKDKQFDNFYVYSRIQYDCILSTEQTTWVENHQVSISHHNPWSYLSVEMSNTVYPLSDFMHKKANGQMRFGISLHMYFVNRCDTRPNTMKQNMLTAVNSKESVQDSLLKGARFSIKSVDTSTSLCP